MTCLRHWPFVASAPVVPDKDAGLGEKLGARGLSLRKEVVQAISVVNDANPNPK